MYVCVCIYVCMHDCMDVCIYIYVCVWHCYRVHFGRKNNVLINDAFNTFYLRLFGVGLHLGVMYSNKKYFLLLSKV